MKDNHPDWIYPLCTNANNGEQNHVNDGLNHLFAMIDLDKHDYTLSNQREIYYMSS